jgi:putative hydroxymethylpyrimidine transport system substrate-binding protein
MTHLRRFALSFTLMCSLVALAAASPSIASVTHRSASAPRISAARCSANRAAGPMTFISAFGYDASVGILDVYAAQQLGYFRQLCLNVVFDANLSFAPSAPEVAAGAATITGEGSAADALKAIGNGAALTAISTFGNTSDYALLTRRSITNLRQLAGQTLGYHAPIPVVLSEMLTKAKVDVAKVHEVNDTSFDPTVLINGPYDALQAYQSNEPLTLEAGGYGKDFRTWKPSQFGIGGTFNVQVVNTAFLKAHRGAVRDFLRAELHAFDYCATRASTCVGYVAKAAGSSYNVAHEIKEWQFETALATRHALPGKGIGVESTSEWVPASSALVRYHLVPAPVDLSVAEDTALASSLYAGRTLIWPGS